MLVYGSGNWSPEGLGNHRVVLTVSSNADLAKAIIPWRRRDNQPETKALILIDGATNKRVNNCLAVNISRECGEIIFAPATGAGTYYLYFMPHTTAGKSYCPNTEYLPAEDLCDKDFRNRVSAITESIELAIVERIESVNEFHSPYPMEVCATQREISRLLSAQSDSDFLIFTEDRKFPIRMTETIPFRWIEKGISSHFSGLALRNEFYTFQLGIFAAFKELNDVNPDFSDLESQDGSKISAGSIRCFNLAGNDWLGHHFSKNVSVDKGTVQPLWIGVDIPESQSPGIYRGTVVVTAADLRSQKITLELNVKDEVIENRGYNDLFRHARLNWLDSRIALDDEVVKPFEPVRLKEDTVSVLGRHLKIDDTGLPASIVSMFNSSNSGVDGQAKEMLESAIRFDVVVDGKTLDWQSAKTVITGQSSGAVSWRTENHSASLRLTVEAKMEFDGHIDYQVSLESDSTVDLENVSLEIPYNLDHSIYMMGMGRQGRFRPESWNWRWENDRINNAVWIGDVNVGLHVKLKDIEPDWSTGQLFTHGPYRDWYNSGMGGCSMAVNERAFSLSAYTGKCQIAAGETLHFNFGLLITPIKVLDKQHWNWRYFHKVYDKDEYSDWIHQASQGSANIINIHHAKALNPFINYPFVESELLKQFASEAKDANMRVLIYYTVRELTCHTAEFWALRSLGDEIFLGGKHTGILADHFEEESSGGKEADTGYSWLVEHLIDNYTPAWHHKFDEARGIWDVSIATTGLSRWHNYYLEGLNWLVKNVGIRGLYLDGIGYDREIMKRVRKVADRAADDCLINFHSGNSFQPQYGLKSPMNTYMEHLPFIDSLWFGEMYDYDETPDYWLVEISGIPFGLFSEMLHGGGNKYRGMAYGMTARLGWWDAEPGCENDPSPMWKFWDEFGISEADMLGYWDENNPVKADRDDVLITTYRKKDKIMFAVGSWATEDVTLKLKIDWDKLHIDATQCVLTAPAIERFQDETNYSPNDIIPIPKGKGVVLILTAK